MPLLTDGNTTSYHTEVANARNIGYDGGRKGAAPLYFVYVLVCRDGSLYTGMTNDLRRRMALHTAGRGAKYTRAHPPAALAGLWRCGGRTAAARLEYAFKTLTRAQKLALLAAPEQVREALPALAGYNCVPVRDMTLERLLEEGYSG